MDERLGQATMRIAEAKETSMSLDGMEVGLVQDAGFYALRACVGEILEKSACDLEALDACLPLRSGYPVAQAAPARTRKAE